MNSFKKLVIKILCCAIVCAAIIPDVYGMKRKLDTTDTADEKSAKRQRNSEDDPSSNGRDDSGSDASPSSNSHSGEVKLEAKQAGKSKNIFSMIQGAQLGKKVSNQKLYNWVKDLPAQIGEREKTETVQQLILAHCTMPDFVFLEWFQQLPEGREEGNPRSRMIALLDKKIKQIFADLTADKPRLLFFFDDSMAGLRKDYAERWAKTCEKAREYVNKLPKGYVRTMVQYLLFKYLIETPENTKIYHIIDRTITRFKGPRDHRYYKIGCVDLSNLNIESFDEVAEVLVVMDQFEPITKLDLSNNKLTSATIPALLNTLAILDLSHNKLTTYTGPVHNGFVLFLYDNNLSDTEKERIRNSCVGSMHVSL